MQFNNLQNLPPNAKREIIADYRRWFSYNNGLKDYNIQYEIYVALNNKRSTEKIVMEELVDESGKFYQLHQAGYDTTLRINAETGIDEVLAYFEKHYLPKEEIEDWYKTKLQEVDRHNNLNSMNGNDRPFSIEQVKVHRKERFYYRVRLTLSIIFYLGVVAALVITFIQSTAGGLLLTAYIGGVMLIFGLMRRFAQGFFIGILKGNSIKINAQQYPEIFKIVEEQCQVLGINKVPEVYIGGGHFNAFVTKLAGRKFLMLFSELVETASRGDYDVLKFVIGHELGHIKRKHLSHNLLLAPSALIPFLSLAHSRGCEYTCDRIGYHFTSQGAYEGILILAAGKEIHTKINIARFVEDAEAESNFWVWFSEKFLTHPHIYKRMAAIKNYAVRGF